MSKRPILKSIFKIVKVILVTLLLLFVIGFIYISINKKSIIADITDQVAEKVKGDLTYKDVDITFFKSFPNLAVSFKDVLLTDTMYKVHQHPFLKAKSVFISLNIYKLISSQAPISGVIIKNGQINMFTDSLGYSNEYLIEPQSKQTTTKKSNSGEIGIRKVEFQNLTITKDDQKRKKFLQVLFKDTKIKIKEAEEKINFELETNSLIYALAFKVKKGPYLQNKTFDTNLDFYLDKKTKRLIFDKAVLYINRQKFLMDAWFDLKKEDPQFSLKLNTEKIFYDSVKSLLTPKIANSLSRVSLTAPLSANATIDGPLKGGEPHLYITGSTTQTDMTTEFMDFNKADLKFLFTNEMDKNIERGDPNSAILITNMKAEWHKFPVVADSIAILNLEVPQLRAHLTSQFELAQLQEVVGNSFKLGKGTGSANLGYVGPIERNNNSNSFLNGFVKINNADLVYVPRNIPMTKVNTEILFANSNVNVTNLSTVIFGNSIRMNGTANNVLSLINTAPNQIVLDWNIESSSLNLNPFLNLIKPRQQVNKRAKVNNSLDEMANKIDLLLEQSEISVRMQAGNMQYKKLQAQNVIADVYLARNEYRLKKVFMNFAGGSINLNGTLLDQGSNRNKVDVNVDLQAVDIAKTFSTFDNFGQTGIEAKNLAGKLNATVKANLLLNKDGVLFPGSTNAVVDFSLKNGALLKYEPLKRIQKFIFKNRDFDNIQFAELKNKLIINGQKITIPPMQIQSSVLSLYVEGLFTPDNKTDLSIRIPLSNLNKRDEEYVPKNKKKDEKIGTSIFLRGNRNNNEDVNFKLDLFKRYYKDN